MRTGIVGGGIIGCAIAYELAKRGAKVDLFEGRGIGAGATQASAGALVPYVEAHEEGPLRHLALRSLSMYDEFVEAVRGASGLAIDYTRCGSLEVAVTSAEAASLKRFLGRAEGLMWLDAPGVRAFQPQLSPHVTGGLVVPFHAYVAAGELTRALAMAAERHGLQVHRAAVREVVPSADHATLVTADGGSHAFDRVVLAGGTWTSQLRGIPAPPIRPVKGQLLRVRCRGGEVRRIVWSSYCYVVPQASGDLLVGATMEEAGFDEEPTPDAAATLLAGFQKLLPGILPSVVEHRVGLRPASPDNLPLVGSAAACRAVVYAGGHFRNGIVLAPLTAKLVTALLLDGTIDPDLQILAPSRFGL